MILPFSTQLNGKPTHFVEKVLSGLLCYELEPEETQKSIVHYSTFSAAKYEWTFEMVKEAKPKFHTIREDKKNRWKVGAKIDFFINCRQKDMFRFAPVLPVVSIQEVSIIHETVFTNKTATIKIDGEWFAAYNFSKGNIYGKLETFIKNDGFDTIEDFFSYFNEDFKGKIIHWTDFKY